MALAAAREEQSELIEALNAASIRAGDPAARGERLGRRTGSVWLIWKPGLRGAAHPRTGTAGTGAGAAGATRTTGTGDQAQPDPRTGDRAPAGPGRCRCDGGAAGSATAAAMHCVPNWRYAKARWKVARRARGTSTRFVPPGRMMMTPGPKSRRCAASSKWFCEQAIRVTSLTCANSWRRPRRRSVACSRPTAARPFRWRPCDRRSRCSNRR